MSSPKSDPVLELRIHGVNNTPPHEMLDVPKDEAVRSFGDDLGSFWRPTAETVAKGRVDEVQGEISRGVVDPSEPPRGRVPEGIHREAYSWGGMVRTTPPDSGPGGVIVAAIARAAWTLLLPFSIGNAAMWTWQLPKPGTRISVGSALIRLACLALTMVFTLAFTSLAIDLLALQCFRGGTTICPPLEAFGGNFARWTDERRVALFSLLPIVALLVVYLISTLSTLRYNVAGRILRTKGGNSDELLGQPRFWQTRAEAHRLALLHLAAGIAMVALVLSFAFAEDVEGVVWLLAGLAIGVLGLCAFFVAATDSSPWERLPRPSDANEAEKADGSRTQRASKDPRLALWVPVVLLLTASIAYLTTAVALGFSGRYRLLPPEIGTASDRLLFIVLVTGAALIAATCFLPAEHRARRAWHGFGSAVFLSIALGISMMLASLLNVVAGDWLNGGAPASRLAQEFPECQIPDRPGDECAALHITVGSFYAPFLGLSLLTVLVAVAALLLMLIRKRVVDGRMSDLAVPATGSPRASLAEVLRREVAKKRARAARIHLVETAVGVLALAMASAIVLTLVRPAASGQLDARFLAFLATWINTSLNVWVLVGLAIIAGLVVGGSKTRRPLALIWDLACFLPRSGHPFGAPCYTERAVPEVARRIKWWLDLPPVDPQQGGAPSQPRSVVLSAHSMGAVVAVSALFALRNEADWEKYAPRIALLTFGIQLRPYFGRFFPEILGPEVIDCIPCGRPRPWATDPWAKADLDGSDTPRNAESSRGVPAAAWINLWRLTDYLGFPAASIESKGNTRDWYAEEIEASGYVGAVDTHGWYYRTPTYQRALTELKSTVLKS